MRKNRCDTEDVPRNEHLTLLASFWLKLRRIVMTVATPKNQDTTPPPSRHQISLSKTVKERRRDCGVARE